MIDPVSSSTATSNSANQAATNKSASGLSSDFETFLKMLTAQARYQDPLEPIDSTEYAAQLAQFSMVEQQVQTNDVLEALVTKIGASQFSSMSNWVGMDVRAAMPGHFHGSPITIQPNPAAISDKVELVVRDVKGVEMQRLTLPVSADPYTWNGLDSAGNAYPHGLYTFTVESQKAGEVILSETAELYGNVEEAQLQNGEVVLILPGDRAILSSAVTALRNP
ncbi:MAG: flagellar basal body rod modification protein [Rhodobacteraceae bacterium]|nr:flagellar basal body rod modification protein [Paracoccaceae bacterium]